MFENIKKGFGVTVGVLLAVTLVQGVGKLMGDKTEENNENPEEKEEA